MVSKGRRKYPQSRSLKRRSPQRQPKIQIIVVCEGMKTEPHYLRCFKSHHSSYLVDLVLVEDAGSPMTIVDEAIVQKKELERRARKSKNSFEGEFEVWGMFDIDEHPNIPQAKDKAFGNNIPLAISNPCFELWVYLHYCDHNAWTHRHDMQKLLKIKMNNYDPSHRKQIDYEEIKDHFDCARSKAMRLIKNRKNEADEGGNPSTNVFELLDVIIENGK